MFLKYDVMPKLTKKWLSTKRKVQKDKILSGKVTNLKSSDDKQGVDVVDPNLLRDLLQVFAWKSSSIQKGNNSIDE